MNSVKELMEIHGYRWTVICHCSGYKTFKYKKGDYQFSWRVNKYQFKVMEGNSTLLPWTQVKDAEKYLSELHGEPVKVSV